MPSHERPVIAHGRPQTSAQRDRMQQEYCTVVFYMHLAGWIRRHLPIRCGTPARTNALTLLRPTPRGIMTDEALQ